MTPHRLPFRARLVVVLGVLAALTVPATAQAAVSTSYAFRGYEVWATSTVGTFVGTARGSSADYATWRASIQHTVQTIPEGTITGGDAVLYTSDLTRIWGRFSGGTLRLVSTGSGSCGTLTHEVVGTLVDVVRSDTGAVGSGEFRGTLLHYRVSIFGRCVAYSASASGTITLQF